MRVPAMRAEPAWRAVVYGRPYQFTAATKSEFRALLKAALGIPRRARLPRGIRIDRLPPGGGKGV